MKETYTGPCDLCGEPITPASSEVQWKRNVGLHMRKRHGIPGRSASSRNYQKRLAEAEERGAARATSAYTQAPARKRGRPRKYPKLLADPELVPVIEEPPTATEPSHETHTEQVEPIALEYCPHCKARFYISRSKI